MGSYKQITKTLFIKTLQEKNVSLFDIVEIRKLFTLKNENTIRHLLRRLKKEEIVSALVKGKYLFKMAKKEPLEFEIANFLVSPSYISLESALSYYGIITQFPYQINSITCKKTRKIKVGPKVYSFAKIKKPYFNDFVRQDDFLIASPQKALFDYLYFAYKGQRRLDLLSEIDRKILKSQKSRSFFQKKAEGDFKKFLLKYKLI